MNRELFNYPSLNCNKCESIGACHPTVEPFYQSRNDTRLMLVGQDPTIYVGRKRVTVVLMLNDPNSQLSKWLKGMLGEDFFNRTTIYATNVVKCFLNAPPSSNKRNGYTILKPYFEGCKEHLRNEITSFKPTYIITLGEPTHKLFCELISSNNISTEMKDAFNGQFIQCTVENHNFKYSPCLHITTFRIAETYGEKVKLFKQNLSNNLP